MKRMFSLYDIQEQFLLFKALILQPIKLSIWQMNINTPWLIAAGLKKFGFTNWGLQCLPKYKKLQVNKCGSFRLINLIITHYLEKIITIKFFIQFTTDICTLLAINFLLNTLPTLKIEICKIHVVIENRHFNM